MAKAIIRCAMYDAVKETACDKPAHYILGGTSMCKVHYEYTTVALLMQQKKTQLAVPRIITPDQALGRP